VVKNSSRPKVFSSRCLGFAACRWDGITIQNAFIERLKNHVDFITVCPEVEIGLGIPRHPIRIVRQNDSFRLIQLNANRDITDVMTGFVGRFLDSLGAVDAFILKEHSPSCGLRDVKVYAHPAAEDVIMKTSGFFGAEIIRQYPRFAVETEARLAEPSVREHFLTRLFAIARFRLAKEKGTIEDLVRFHSENRFLLSAHSHKELVAMESIVSKCRKKETRGVFEEYETHLYAAFEGPSDSAANVDVMVHALDYFPERLSSKKRKLFFDSLEKYRQNKIPLTIPLNILKNFIISFKIDHLLRQTYFEPYPPELA